MAAANGAIATAANPATAPVESKLAVARRRPGRMLAFALVVVALISIAACSRPVAVTPLPTSTPSVARSGYASIRQPEHIVVVIFENKRTAEILDAGQAPTINALAARGATYDRSYGITHPSQPNYLALFSGSTHGIDSNACPQSLAGKDNLASQLQAHGRTFVGYAEGLPRAGYSGCVSGRYARKHAPWTNFTDLAPEVAQPFSTFPADYATLPAVAFVVPDLCHDMHDCPVQDGDSWLRDHLLGYADWARTHHSLLIITFDEDDGTAANRIATIAVGQDVTAGRFHEVIDQYSVLRTIETCEGLPPLGVAANRTPLRDVCP